MPETWAECDVCERRFYCERSDLDGDSTPRCPVCGAPAARTTTTGGSGGGT